MEYSLPVLRLTFRIIHFHSSYLSPIFLSLMQFYTRNPKGAVFSKFYPENEGQFFRFATSIDRKHCKDCKTALGAKKGFIENLLVG